VTSLIGCCCSQIEKVEVKTINEPRPGKKLLVLDLDYTLLDFKGTAESMAELKRPYCDEFLTVVSSLIFFTRRTLCIDARVHACMHHYIKKHMHT
jgi:hypothetical protein